MYASWFQNVALQIPLSKHKQTGWFAMCLSYDTIGRSTCIGTYELCARDYAGPITKRRHVHNTAHSIQYRPQGTVDQYPPRTLPKLFIVELCGFEHA